jgi:hypothetical protein
VKPAKLLAGKDSFLLDQTLLSERVGDVIRICLIELIIIYPQATANLDDRQICDMDSSWSVDIRNTEGQEQKWRN